MEPAIPGLNFQWFLLGVYEFSALFVSPVRGPTALSTGRARASQKFSGSDVFCGRGEKQRNPPIFRSFLLKTDRKTPQNTRVFAPRQCFLSSTTESVRIRKFQKGYNGQNSAGSEGEFLRKYLRSFREAELTIQTGNC